MNADAVLPVAVPQSQIFYSVCVDPYDFEKVSLFIFAGALPKRAKERRRDRPQPSGPPPFLRHEKFIPLWDCGATLGTNGEPNLRPPPHFHPKESMLSSSRLRITPAPTAASNSQKGNDQMQLIPGTLSFKMGRREAEQRTFTYLANGKIRWFSP